MQLYNDSCKTKVLVLGAGPPTTGGIPSFLSLLKEYTDSDPELTVDFINGSPSHKGNIIRRLFTSLRVSIVLFLSLLKRYDVVHIHVSGGRSFMEKSWYNLICKIMRTRTIFHIHGSDLPIFYESAPFLGKIVLAWLLRVPDRIVVLYSALVPFFKCTSNRTHVRVVANGIAFPPHRPRWDIKKSRTDVVFLGHIMNEKGLYVILQAILLMSEKEASLAFHLLGSEKRKGELTVIKNAFENQDLRNVYFHGHKKGDEKDAYLLKSDIFILPSLEEAFPFSVLEAMSYGLPVVATRVGAIPELIEDDVNGYLIDPGNAHQLASAITRLAENHEARLRMGKNNYEKVRELYSFEKTLGKLKEVFAEVKRGVSG